MAEPQPVHDVDHDPQAVYGYSFGPFRMDVSGYQLLRDGQKVELTSKSFDTLRVLIRNRHRVVVKEELLSAVWPDASVTDDSLIQSISALRRALGDDATNPRYVSTVARRGYRFIAPITEWTEAVEHTRLTASPATASNGESASVTTREWWPSMSRRRTVALAQVVAATALLMVGWAIGRQSASTDRVDERSGLLRFTQGAPAGTKLSSGGALAPNGSYVAFAAEEIASGRPHLWVRALDSDHPRMLEGTDGASRPFWSPDSEFIGFFADGNLKTVRLAGGPPTALVAVGPRPAGAAWSPRGQIIYSTWLSGLSRISASGGAPTKLTDLGSEFVAHAWPHFLPDGDHFLYSAIAVAGKAQITVGRLSMPSSRTIVEADAGAVFAPAGFLLFTRNGLLTAHRFDLDSLSISGDPISVVTGNVASPSMTNGTMLSASSGGLLAFGGATGESELVWFDRAGRRLGPLSSSVPLHNPVLSVDERQVFGNTYAPSQLGVWTADVERGATIRLIPDASMPMPSPDGRLLGFTSRQRGSPGLFTQPLGDNAAVNTVVLIDADRKAITDWSRDGRFLIYQVVRPKEGQDIWMVSRSGDPKPTALVASSANEIHGRLSPDGRWLAYASDESGRWEVYVQSFPSGNQRQTISPAGGAEPQWSADGRELFYVAEDHAVMAVSIVAGSSLRAGKPQVLFRPQLLGEPTTYRSHYAVTGNGQRFLVDVLKETALDPINILSNWTPR